jgi:hypothetical protein
MNDRMPIKTRPRNSLPIVMPESGGLPKTRNNIPATDIRFVGEMFRRAMMLTTGSRGTAWGLLGSVGGYCVAHVAAFGIVASGVGMPLGFITAAAIYSLVNPQPPLIRCLDEAKYTFISGRITKGEYAKMRSRCLELHH